ncbi:hypothetical protein HFO89_08635 [Rhizobium leguminosarum]|uniref:sacsin N-terminal ATP-binding-like domain-containing protein n=1 Tax=Rhizobium leguminosarum TaxID=384 RepID=UPI001C947D67|nr:hypothetical protein [Rhizobium leguminosarum]MBY5456422.1 hypothetical protein [Rhizobium leguminosarum]
MVSGVERSSAQELLAPKQNNIPAEADSDDRQRGFEAAHLIWSDNEDINALVDPRTPAFANAVLDTLAGELAAAPGAMKRAIRTAARSAERLNVEPFQGLIEVIQNADDLLAREVRFALRDVDGHQQLLIVHDGDPVTCHHVLGMIIPYFTTKEHDPDQRGRFGIGLKTLARVASSMSIHSHPYHFSGDQETLRRSAEEGPIDGFYDPASDTIIVLHLKPGFDEPALRAWFEKWDHDGLIFLSSVRSFHWYAPGEGTVLRKSVTPGAWYVFADSGLDNGIELIERRDVSSEGNIWTVWKARVRVPPDKHPEHKARNETVHISVAVSAAGIAGHLHIGFRTRVPVSLPVSIDAPFDPSTAREGLVEDDWNTWLIAQSANVLAAVVRGALAADPEKAWRLAPLQDEGVGNGDDTWLSGAFAEGFERVRADLAERALIRIGADAVPLSGIAYEAPELSGLLTAEDLSALSPESRTLPEAARDAAGRWRRVLDEIAVSRLVGAPEFLDGFADEKFAAKDVQWWVRAAGCLVAHYDDTALFGAPFWLTDGRIAVSCDRPEVSGRKLVSGAGLSDFATRRHLLNRLHPAYGETAAGQRAINWLVQNAAFTAAPGPEDELEAFAKKYAETPQAVEDAELREIRDLFDQLSERTAERIGPAVGAAILVDGVTYRNGKPQKIKVSPTQAYLSKTLDGEYPYWPIAAEKVSGLQWIAARYEDQLKTGVGRGERRRGEDGKVSRGARRFMMLLGAECAPRLVAESGNREKGPTRGRELTASGANSIPEDIASPDLERVLASFAKMTKKQRKVRSPALFRGLSRNWNRLYASKTTVRSRYLARTRYHEKSSITASWLCRLKDIPWIAVGKGELAPAATVVVKSPATQPHYPNNAFIVGIGPDDVNSDMATRLSIRTEMLVSDVVAHLENVRDGMVEADEADVMQIYRNLAKLCPTTPAWNTRIGDLSVQDLRRRFGQGAGLIYISSSLGWRRPDQLLRGPDIFHDRRRFVPGGPSCENFWITLAVPTPDLDDCIGFCRSLAEHEPDKTTTEKLIDVYRYMEPLLADAQKRHRDRLRALPLVCSGKWETERPIFFVHDEELRQQLAAALMGQRFWTPACDTRELPRLTSVVGLTKASPECRVSDQRDAALDQGDSLRDRFERAVDLLSDELARNDPATRGRLRIGWDVLRAIPLYVYDDAPRVVVRDPAIAAGPINVRLRSMLVEQPLELHVQAEAIALREHGGRAIASLFPPEVRRKIDVEWLAAWMNPDSIAAVGLKLASDEELRSTLDEEAKRINAAPKAKIKIKPSAANRLADVTPRTLKETAGVIAAATVQVGTAPKQEPASKPKLTDERPEQSRPTPPETRSAPRAFDSTDLEQAGWEVLTKVLITAGGKELEDFRKRHGVGADGALDWKTFVEMKATGRGPAPSIEMSTTEYERAKKEGMSFMLALVSGLETGEKLEVRLIFDPAGRASCKPTNGMRFYALNEAPAIVVSFDEGAATMDGP